MYSISTLLTDLLTILHILSITRSFTYLIDLDFAGPSYYSPLITSRSSLLSYPSTITNVSQLPPPSLPLHTHAHAFTDTHTHTHRNQHNLPRLIAVTPAANTAQTTDLPLASHRLPTYWESS